MSVKLKLFPLRGDDAGELSSFDGQKLVALAMEGKFSSEGLQSINDQDDILMAMARELVMEKGIGERADAVWATLQKKQEDTVGTRLAEDAEVDAEQNVSDVPSIEPTTTQVDQWSALTTEMESARRKASQRPTSATPDGQLELF